MCVWGVNFVPFSEKVTCAGFIKQYCIHRVNWRKFEDEERGHIACCTVQQLHQKILFSPDLGNIDVLTNLEGQNPKCPKKL